MFVLYVLAVQYSSVCFFPIQYKYLIAEKKGILSIQLLFIKKAIEFKCMATQGVYSHCDNKEEMTASISKPS